MKAFSRRFSWLVIVAAFASTASGQALVVSSKSADDLIASVRSAVVSGMGEAGQAQPILQILDAMRGPDMLKGLDRTKPMGVYATLSANPGELPGGVVLIPVTSQKDFLDLLGRFNIPTAEVKGVNGVTHSLTTPGQPMTLFGRFEGGYAAFATAPAGPPALANLKPATVFAGTTVPLMAKIAVDQLPSQLKQMVVAQVDARAATDREKKPGETEENYNARMAGMDLVLDAFKAMLRDGKDLSLALNVDPKKGDLSIDLTAKALPKTSVAGSFQAFGSKASLFRSIGAGTSGSAFARMPIADSIRKVFQASVTRGREELAKSQSDPGDVALANEILDLVEPLISGPELDLGAALFGPFAVADEKSTYAGLFGLKVGDGGRVDKVFRELAVKAEKEKPPGIEKVTLDVAKSPDGKSAIHEVRLNGEPAAALGRFGEPVIRVTTRSDAVLFAVGSRGLDRLKQAVEALGSTAKPAQPVPQIQAQASINAILPLTADDPKAEGAMRGMLKEAGIFQGPDASRDTGMLRIAGTADSMSVLLKLEGPAIKFLMSMGMNMAVARPGR